MDRQRKIGLKKEIKLYEHQKFYVKKILKDIETTNKINYFISLPQGAGKTLIALFILSELLNKKKVERALVLLPSRNLVDQWVEEAQKMFFGLKLLDVNKIRKNKKGNIEKKDLMVNLKHSNAVGIAMTIHSFRNFMKKGYFGERDFDLVIIDEASDSTLAKDFLEKYRMSYYLKGLEKWKNLKLLVFPKDVDEDKLKTMIKKFNENLSEIIREEPENIEKLQYEIKDPIIIDDPLVNYFTEVLNNEYKTIKRKVLNLLKKLNIKGYQENLETLLRPKTMQRLKRIYRLDEETITIIQVLIIKYILIKHLLKWFLYSSRKELKKTLLASQFQVKEWLDHKDKKLEKLKEVVKNLLDEKKKIYIYSEYVSTAEMIFSYLKEDLNLKDDEIGLITGRVEDQYTRLDRFKKKGKILISTPVFDKGTDIPEVNSAIIFTPSRNIERLHQIKGRIRGGEIITLAYKGYEEEIIKYIVQLLRD